MQRRHKLGKELCKMKPNKTFNINVRELQIIEDALNKILDHQLKERGCSRNNAIQIQAERSIVEIRSLLGSLHNQKTWYRPNDKIYISG